MRDKRAKHAVVEARQTTLFAFKAVGAHLLSKWGGGEVMDKRAKHAVVETRLTPADCI